MYFEQGLIALSACKEQEMCLTDGVQERYESAVM